jgi:hypothetical protein
MTIGNEAKADGAGEVMRYARVAVTYIISVW